jgi:hypothetical protein
MWKHIAIAGATAAVIGGAGTAALAESGSSSPATSAADSASASSSALAPGTTPALSAAKAHRPALARLRKLQHGTWVTGDGTSSDVTHDIIKGKATAVSATSITVRAADSTTQTYAVNSDTAVHTRAVHKGAAITAVKSGDEVVLAGTGTTSLTATQVIDTAK